MTLVELYDTAGLRRVGTIHAPCGPLCGEDVCEACGECMGCGIVCTYDTDGVFDGPGRHEHLWIVHEDGLPRFLAGHERAIVERDGGPA